MTILFLKIGYQITHLHVKISFFMLHTQLNGLQNISLYLGFTNKNIPYHWLSYLFTWLLSH